MCALEDEVFDDGAEAQMECNKCVCACGNWVCTALACTGEFLLLSSHTTRAPSSLCNMVTCISGKHQMQEYVQEGEDEEELTEEEWNRRVEELKALQVNSLTFKNYLETFNII